MRTVVLLAFLVSSVAFSSETRSAELLDSKKLIGVLRGNSLESYGFILFQLQCSKILGIIFIAG